MKTAMPNDPEHTVDADTIERQATGALYADIARNGYAAVAKDALSRKTDELATLRALVEELTARLEQALVYLEHPEVDAIPFAMPASMCAGNARTALAKARKVTP